MTRFLDDCDVVLCAVTAQAAFPHGASYDPDTDPGANYTEAFSCLGWPAATVRCGTSPEAFPIGVQIAAAPAREDVVLAVAEQLEHALGGFQPPPI